MTLTKYTIGFVLSLLLSLVAYYYTVSYGGSMWIVAVLGTLAIVQMIIQLVFFLHLGEEVGPRYKLASFVFMFTILLIVVGGSLWIMANLDENMMHLSPAQKDNYMTTKNDMSF